MNNNSLKQDKLPFCWAPWVAIQYASIRYEGGIAPCCEWQTEDVGWFRGNLSEYKDSKWLADVKKQMLDHDMEKINVSCKECITDEKVSNHSSRTWMHNKVRSKDWNTEDFQFLDFRPGNTCNLKCRMCNARNSDQIADEEGITVTKRNVDDIINLDFLKIKNVRVIGGEPSIDPKIHNFLDYLIKENFCSNINLQFSTNCTNTNSKWLNRISKFRHVHMDLSIDATGNILEYCRKGVSWPIIKKNIETLKQIGTYTFHVTAGIYNYSTIEKWFDYFLDQKYVHQYPLFGPSEQSLLALPNAIKEEKIEWLSKIDHPYAKEAISIFNMFEFNKNHYDRFVWYTKNKDKIRNESVLDLDPIFKRIMNYV